jgi:hypothetical protein
VYNRAIAEHFTVPRVDAARLATRTALTGNARRKTASGGGRQAPISLH